MILCVCQEFCKEVEGRSALKSSVLQEGNQLLRLKKVDTVLLRAELSRIDREWSELLTHIPNVQEKLHQVHRHTHTHTHIPNLQEKLHNVHTYVYVVFYICISCSDPDGEAGVAARPLRAE